MSDTLRKTARVALGAMLMFAGTSHLSFARQEFQAQVPPSIPELLPVTTDQVVLASGVVEIGLGAAIAFAPKRFRPLVGVAAAAFFVAVFPGNVAQYTEHRDAFGLDTDTKRAVRLLFQPALVAWAYWSTRVRD